MAGVALLLLTVATSGTSELLRQSQEAFAEGVRLRDDADAARPQFRRAADLFEELRRGGFANPALFRDQGNACFLAGDLPGAILAYRRGLRLAPSDATLQRLLGAAREHVVYRQSGTFARPPTVARPPWLPRLSPSAGLLLAWVAYALGWLTVTRWWMVRRPAFLWLALAAFVVTGLLAVAVGLEEVQERDADLRPLVVIAEGGVLLRRGNGEVYPRRYETPVNRGVEARLLFERGDWLQIELTGGETGWVPRKYALIDREFTTETQRTQRRFILFSVSSVSLW
jgi:uncharacterized protein YgiM (DUF1202 family)